MQLDELDGCKVVALDQPTLPPRSRLYSLAPIGIGTPEVESLTGYVARMAMAHCVTVSLLRKEFGGKIGNLDTFLHVFSTSSGVAPTTASCVRAVESLTHRRDLCKLTMLIWANVLPSNGLLRSCRAWCPDCLREQTTIYEPLIWRLAAVEICPRHRRLLNSRCSLCFKTMPVLGWHTWPGQCSRCGCYLGDDPPGSASNKAASFYQLWKANAIGEMLASQDEPFPSGSFRGALRLWTQNAIPAETVRLLDEPGATVRKWLNGTCLPTLEKLVRICRKLETSPLPFLTLAPPVSRSKRIVTPGARAKRPKRSNRSPKVDLAKIRIELEATLRDGAGAPPSITDIAGRMGISTTTLYFYFPELCHAISETRNRLRLPSWFSKFDLVKARVELEAALRNGASNPPSAREVCRRMGHSAVTVYKYFPELCRAISKRHMEWRAENRVRSEQALIEEVCRAAASLKEDGLELTTKRVYSRITKPGIFRSPIAGATLARIRLEGNNERKSSILHR